MVAYFAITLLLYTLFFHTILLQQKDVLLLRHVFRLIQTLTVSVDFDAKADRLTAETIAYEKIPVIRDFFDDNGNAIPTL